ncbi:MAG: phospho-N-acetylmuramoyl-pentapeptide-transferase [Wolbachia endosymbiont of Menacanthus eurysternus]|nr:MAG: phospho-N-acetylmuramoyl-pentapeptide-transferase [Wolbachia endosymbiont of Menacanthus eurysternus]
MIGNFLYIKVFCTSFISGFVLFYFFVKFFKKICKDGQPIRLFGPESHLIKKKHVPTMGGIVILVSSLLSILLWIQLTAEILLLIFVTLSFAIIGFIDDFLKLKANSYLGLRVKIKILAQVIITLIGILMFKLYFPKRITEETFFIKEIVIYFGHLYIPFIVLVIVSSSNAVNITDGLDGLAATQVINSFIFLGLIAHLTQGVNDMDIVLFCIALVGALLSFLWFNIYPARVFMGDVGSLSIGAALGLVSVFIKREMLFAIIGIIFVIETLSVIIQVLYFRYTRLKYGNGIRIFLMTPIHHHFEKSGWSEIKIVVRFLLISIICSVFTIAFLL